MNQIADFNCDVGAMLRITPGLLTAAGSSFPAAYLESGDMAKTALELKRENNACFCMLPFCHTLEAEATSGFIHFDDVETGPRFGEPTCKSLDALLQMPEIDYSAGRMAQTLEACRLLHQQGEYVMIALTGPFTWLNVLCGTAPLFKWLRKEPEKMQQVFDHIRAELLRFTEKALEAGADLISYSDSVGGVNVLGPKNMAHMAETVTLPLLHEIQALADGKALLFLVPEADICADGLRACPLCGFACGGGHARTSRPA